LKTIILKKYLDLTINGITEAVIHCSDKPLNCTEVKEKFIVETTLGTTFDISCTTVPVLALVHPLCVIPDYGSNGTSFIVVLPKCNWSRFFGDKIMGV
jgi:hypothetical protein